MENGILDKTTMATTTGERSLPVMEHFYTLQGPR